MRLPFFSPLSAVTLVAVAAACSSGSVTGGGTSDGGDGGTGSEGGTTLVEVAGGTVSKSAPSDWNGTDEIAITNAGVNPLVGTGGIAITFDPAATKITAKGSFSARTTNGEESSASLAEAIATFAVTASSVTCGNGGAHGQSPASASGCKLLEVTLPAGSAAKPLKLKITGGNGGIRFTGAVPTIAALAAKCSALGDVAVNASPQKDATIVVAGGDAVTVGLPASFSSKSVVLKADPEAGITTSDFPGMASGQPYPTSGATANAAALLDVQSEGILSDDKVTISKNP